MRKEMLPVIPEFTGTEYSAVGFWLSAILLALFIALAGYIAGRSAAKRFGGKKATTALIFSAVTLVTSAALICFFGVSATAIRGSVMCIIMLYACTQDIKTRECDDFLSVMLGITGIAGKEPSELVKDIFAFAAILIIMLLSAAVTKNGIGGADVKFASSAAFVLGFVNTSAALIVGLLAAVIVNSIAKKKSFPLLPYLSPAFMLAYFIG